MIIKKLICSMLIFGLALGMLGCEEKESFERRKYSLTEIQALFDQNIDLFDELASTILDDEDFLEKGNIYPDGSTSVMSANDKNMALFNEASQKVIQKFMKFEAYSVTYKFREPYVDVIWVTFIGDENPKRFEGCTFHYLVDQSDQFEVEQYIRYCEQRYEVRRLSNGWLLAIPLTEPAH